MIHYIIFYGVILTLDRNRNRNSVVYADKATNRKLHRINMQISKRK